MFFQIVPETESNSNWVRYDYKKKGEGTYCILILIIKFVIVFKLIIFNKFVSWYYDSYHRFIFCNIIVYNDCRKTSIKI